MGTLNTKQEILMSRLQVGDKSEIVTNPYTGAKVTLEPKAAALYDFIKGCEAMGSYKSFDEARYIFMELWPEEYMQLLD